VKRLKFLWHSFRKVSFFKQNYYLNNDDFHPLIWKILPLIIYFGWKKCSFKKKTHWIVPKGLKKGNTLWSLFLYTYLFISVKTDISFHFQLIDLKNESLPFADEETKVVTCRTRGSRVFSTVRVFMWSWDGFHWRIAAALK